MRERAKGGQGQHEEKYTDRERRRNIVYGEDIKFEIYNNCYG